MLILIADRPRCISSTPVWPRGPAALVDAPAGHGPAARRRTAQRERRVELAAAEAAEDDPAFAPDVVRARPRPAVRWRSRPPGTPATDRLRAPGRPRAAARVGAAAGRLRRRGLAQPGRRPIEAPQGRVRRPRTGRRRRTTGWSSGSRPGSRLRARTPTAQRVARAGRLQRDGDGARVLDAGKARRPLDPALDRAGCRGRARAQRADRGHAVVRRAGAARRGAGRGRGGRRGPDGANVAEVADLDYDGDARAAALDLSLADGRFAPDMLEVAAPPGRRRVGRGGRRRRRRAARDRHPGGRQRAAASGRSERTRTRLVVRGPEIEQIRIAGSTRPPSRRR